MPVFQHSVWLFTEFLRKHFPKSLIKATMKMEEPTSIKRYIAMN